MRCGSCECLFEATLPIKTKKKKSKRRDDDDDEDDDDDFEESTRKDYLGDKPKPKGMAITSMILGMIALVSAVMGLILGVMGVGCCCFSFISWPFVGLSSILSIAGLIFGFVSMKGDGKPFWLTGIISSGIALILSLLIIILSVLGIGRMAYQVSTFPTFPAYVPPTYPAYVPPTYSTPTFPTQPKKVITRPGDFKVVLVSIDSNKAVVLRVLLDAVGLKQSEASKFMIQNNLPKDVITDIDKTSAETIKNLLEDAGAKATVE